MGDEKRRTERIEVTHIYEVDPADYFPNAVADGVSHDELAARLRIRLHDLPAIVLSDVVQGWSPEKTLLNGLDPYRGSEIEGEGSNGE